MIAQHDDTDDDELDGATDRPDLVPFAATDVRLLDASDLAWITIIVDIVMSCIGQPWRVLRERLEHAPIRAPRVAAILAAMRRLMGSRAERTKIARKVRALVLGHPVLDEATRTERLATAELELGIEAAELESLLWIDLTDERPVSLPDGRPDEARIASFANVDRIQHALRRARHVRVHAWGNALPLIRMAARCGLLTRVSAPSAPSPSSTAAPIVIDIVGPLSLFHQTNVYGRAIASIVPMLSALDRFIVEIDADFGYGMAALRVTSPALLPPPPSEARKPTLASRVAGALDRAGGIALGAAHVGERRLRIELDPDPIVSAHERLFPDLAVAVIEPAPSPASRASTASTDDLRESDADLVPDLPALLAAHLQQATSIDRPRADQTDRADRRDRAARVDRTACWYIEIVGFATADYLTAKLARYAAAGIERIIFVVDDTRAPEVGESGTPGERRHVVSYKPREIGNALLAIIEEPG